ncbi:MAG: hypothetical protein AAF635_10025 [Cyanobacteria bacterium P01_C01_bin.69]
MDYSTNTFPTEAPEAVDINEAKKDALEVLEQAQRDHARVGSAILDAVSVGAIAPHMSIYIALSSAAADYEKLKTLVNNEEEQQKGVSQSALVNALMRMVSAPKN